MRFLPLLFLLRSLAAASPQSLALVADESVHATPNVSLSPSGRFAVVQNADSSISLWSAAPTPKQLAKPGTSRALFSWSPDDTSLCIDRNGNIGCYELPGGKPRGGFAGSSAPLSLLSISPNGRDNAFIRANNLWIFSNARDLKPLTKTGSPDLLIGVPDPLYAYEFHVPTHFWWSPDSSSIAFIETQFPDSDHYMQPGARLPTFRLKILNVATYETRTVFESTEEWPYILRVAWLPDSRRLAFYRMNRLQTIAELCIFDSGALKTVVTEKDTYWLNAPDSPLFVQNGKRMVISSERSGARHLYLYELSGSLVRDLTPTDIEIYQLHPAEDPKGGVFVTATNGNKREQHLFRIDLEGGPMKQLTTKPGWHDVQLSVDGKSFLDTYSSAVKPPSVSWFAPNGSDREVFQSPVTQKAIPNELLDIKTHDNIPLPARLFKPEDFKPQRRYPVILYTFSGPQGRVAHDAWGGWQMAWNRFMVNEGFLVVAVDVRGSGGYGHLFEEYIHYRFGAQETADLREVVSFLRRQTYVDGDRLGIWGCDYGAHTVVHAMLQFPGGFKAAFADSPITEWNTYNAYFAERYLGLPAKRFTEYHDSSALDDAMRMTGTLLVASSPTNPIIRNNQVEALQKAFAELKKNKDAAQRFHIIPLDDVDYREHAPSLAKLFSQMSDFFKQTL